MTDRHQDVLAAIEEFRAGRDLASTADYGRVICWFGDAPATCEYWFEPRQEWRPICDSHELVGRDNLPPHYFRDLPPKGSSAATPPGPESRRPPGRLIFRAYLSPSHAFPSTQGHTTMYFIP